ncbi:isochorismatase family cysteine hydrolase [Komagataeibacter sp. FXV3]|uniref:cysteine hydrolase family protein n=1 Tax=Komagataeibacter sp. FXV3 TaxID=2608998 RepID=UPI00187B9997|nr:cysteine hydrolase [Komagataeibacter sp. FXV3]
MISAKPFNFPYDGNLAAKSTALIVIDMQQDFLSETGYFAKQGYDPSRLRSILPVISKLIATCRDVGIRIIHTRQGYRSDKADMTPYEKWRRNICGIGDANVLVRGSPGFEIVPEIDVRPDDIIIDKTCNSSFTYTDLEHVLHAQDITHLIFTGCTTDVCVHTSLREACDRNFQCLTVSDACASGDQYAHEAALHMITVENGVFGTISDSYSVINGLSKIRNCSQ